MCVGGGGGRGRVVRGGGDRLDFRGKDDVIELTKNFGNSHHYQKSIIISRKERN